MTSVEMEENQKLLVPQGWIVSSNAVAQPFHPADYRDL
jgi:hypothetical protein